MSDNRFDMLEFGDATPKAEPNKDVFKNAGGLQVREGSTAKQDDNGNWFNAIGLQSTETHRHVAKIWQDKCVSLESFYSTLKAQDANKVDVVKAESAIRLQDSSTLLDGTPLTKSGMNSLRLFTDIPSSMISFMEERGYNDELVKFVNDELNRREREWANKGKDAREFRVRTRHDDDGNTVARAIVSERYGVIDNLEAMEMIIDALPSKDAIKDALASHLHNDGDDMFGNLLLPDNIKSEPDSDYGVGIAFRNSEVRNSTFKVSPFLFRAICLNGMIWGRQDSSIKVNQRHMGNIDKQELREEVRRAIVVALSQGNDLLTLLGHSKHVEVKNPEQVIAQLSRDNKMTIAQGKLWHKGYLESLQEASGHSHDRTAFGIVNGLTRSAQQYTGSTREQMETIASAILAPAIDADLQAISKRWGLISERAKSLDDDTVLQYAYIR
ncbi:MAG: hypothetical protein RLZZ64_1435 [Bacteroidota bacterium]|jgi:hypothetical protein